MLSYLKRVIIVFAYVKLYRCFYPALNRLQRQGGQYSGGVPQVMLLPKGGDVLQSQRPSVSALFANRGQAKKQVPPNVKLPVQKRRTATGPQMHVSIDHSSQSRVKIDNYYMALQNSLF
jgi:hypothetical protein